jgi:hypothetical protein
MSSDIFDDASDMEQMHRDILINEIRKQKPLKTTGRCLYCNAELSDRKFCDVHCAADWENEQRLKRISGRY